MSLDTKFHKFSSPFRNKKAYTLNRIVLMIGTLIVGIMISVVLFQVITYQTSELSNATNMVLLTKINDFIGQAKSSSVNYHEVLLLNKFMNYQVSVKNNSFLYTNGNEKTIDYKFPLTNYIYLPSVFSNSAQINIYKSGPFVLITNNLTCNLTDEKCDVGCIIEGKCDPKCLSTVKDGICDPYCIQVKDGVPQKDRICDPDCVDHKFDGFYDPDCYNLGICDPDSTNIKDGICNPSCAKQGICDPDCVNDPACNAQKCDINKGDNCLNDAYNCLCASDEVCKVGCPELASRLNLRGCVRTKELSSENSVCQASCTCKSNLQCDETGHCCPNGQYYVKGTNGNSGCKRIHNNGICDVNYGENCQTYPGECQNALDICCPSDSKSNKEGYLTLTTLYKKNHICNCNSECSSGNCVSSFSGTLAKHCCPKGKFWDGTGCEKPTVCAQGTSNCQNNGYWPNHKGLSISINEPLKSCDVFEVCRHNILSYAQKAIDCCYEKNPDTSAASLCTVARSKAGITATAVNINNPDSKACAAYYVAIGESNAYYSTFNGMTQYYWPETRCDKGKNAGVSCTSDGSTTYPGFSGATCSVLPGNPSPRGWLSDLDVSKDSCIFSDLPAHVDLNIVHTGTCADYSITLTTLLRMVGYSTSEVYTALGYSSYGGHAFNLVKLPGDSKFTLFDTVGGEFSDPPVVPKNYPWTWWPYCQSIVNAAVKTGNKNCMNDYYYGKCPKLSNINGCS